MKTRVLLSSLIVFSFLMFGASMPPQNGLSDDKLLEVVRQLNHTPLFNYAAKMAAVDATPYKPGQPTFVHTTFFKSLSKDSSTHGGKIFKLYAKEDTPYAYDNSQPLGQTLIMATWNWEEVQTKKGSEAMVQMSDSAFLKPVAQANYYIMYKPDTANYPTDRGWIYAVVSPDGKRILDKGLIISCIDCHSKSGTDRMFGAR